jgi:hypothetical protein
MKFTWDNPFIGKNTFNSECPGSRTIEKTVEAGGHAKVSFVILDSFGISKESIKCKYCDDALQVNKMPNEM